MGLPQRVVRWLGDVGGCRPPAYPVAAAGHAAVIRELERRKVLCFRTGSERMARLFKVCFTLTPAAAPPNPAGRGPTIDRNGRRYFARNESDARGSPRARRADPCRLLRRRPGPD